MTITARVTRGSKGLPDLGGLGIDLLGGLGKSESLTPYDKLIEVVAAEDGAARLLQEDALMRRLFPADWDPQRKEWRQPQGMKARLRGQFNALFGFPGWRSPGAEPVLGLLDERLKVVANDNGRTHTLRMYDPDPKVAHDALLLLLQSADTLLRERELKVNADNVMFLRAKLVREEMVDVRDVLSRRLGEEFVSSAMLASKGPYSYEVLKSLTVSSRPVSPRPLLTLVLSIVAGLVVGYGIIILVHKEWGNKPAAD